tara:strand:+ start:6179 stop:7324 length:1146 start_codon:yes stop_codon:yes gene_type:complete
MSTEIKTQIVNSFKDFVDGDEEEVVENLMKISENSKFNQTSVNKEFKKYLEEMGAEDDLLNDMLECGMKAFKECIVPNKSTLYEKPKMKLNSLKKKSTPVKKAKPESATKTEKAASDNSDSDSADDGNGKKTKAKRASGWTLFRKAKKEEIIERLQSEWNEKYPDEEWVKNEAQITSELSKMWKVAPKEEADEFKKRANAINKENGIVSAGKKAVNDSDKGPVSAFNMFNKLKRSEILAQYRKDNKISEDEKIKTTKVFTLTSKAWKEADEDTKAQMQTEADKFNKEHDRKPKVKESKSGSKDPKKTNPYLEFCKKFREEWREDHPRDAEDFDSYAEQREMNSKWKEIKKNEKEFESWKIIADEMNEENGFAKKEETEDKE